MRLEVGGEGCSRGESGPGGRRAGKQKVGLGSSSYARAKPPFLDGTDLSAWI